MEENKRLAAKKLFNQQVRYMIGFMFYILLTAFSLWAAVFSSYSYTMVLAAISVLAFVQAIIRLFQIQPSQPE